MLGTRLVCIILYVILRKIKNIILIPLTLCLFIFGSCFGPWGMFGVAERSQLKRLQVLLEKNGAFSGGKIVKLSETDFQKVSIKDRNQILSILDYLSSAHGFEGMKEWFDTDCRKKIFTDSTNRYRYEKTYDIKECIGMNGYANYRNEEAEDMSMNVYCEQLTDVQGFDISGYDYIYHFTNGQYANGDEKKDESYTKLEKNKMTFYVKGEKQFEIQLDSIAQKLRALPHSKYNNYNNAKPADLTFEAADMYGHKIKLLFSSFYSTISDTSIQIKSINGYVLMKKK